MIVSRPDGSRWANTCALCRGERKIGVGVFHSDEAPECGWCRAVLEKYGSYYYPIDKSNEHLFPAAPSVSQDVDGITFTDRFPCPKWWTAPAVNQGESGGGG